MEKLLEVLFKYAVPALIARAYGLQVGYQFWGAKDDVGAAIYGYSSVFMVAAVAAVALWPAVHRIIDEVISFVRDQRPERSSKLHPHPEATSAADVKKSIEDGLLLTYNSRIDRDFDYNSDGINKRKRIRTPFVVSRNTLAMSYREKTAVRIFYALRQAGRLPANTIDRIEFALSWGDGRGQAGKINVTAPTQLFLQYGIKGPRDWVSLEAGYRDAACEPAISELFNYLQQAATQGAGPDVVNLYSELRRSSTGGEGSSIWN